MISPESKHEERKPSTEGYDASVTRRQDDFLNRWPFAREILGIATTGPNDWSVRAGIYGEWGTGKTSVLKFVSALAAQDGHVVIWFDPWQYSTKPDLWQAFVLKVLKELGARLGRVPGANVAMGKALMGGGKKAIGVLTRAANKEVAGAVEVGLDLLKKYFSFSKKDLESLHTLLNGKRVIILIDDLDRTAPELVPEILFALKELMDIPGFSFVCAFDPVVVGQVLGDYHPGFGSGLKFLDKIIDYPRWLPQPPQEGLIELALSDAKRLCPEVPASGVRDVIPMIPSNPRAVRQFIRLLALLRPQVQRHYPRELNWPVILAASVLKVRYPQVVHAVLVDTALWNSLAVVEMGLRDDDKKKRTQETIREHVVAFSEKCGIPLDQHERMGLEQAILALCSRTNPFFDYGEHLSYQFSIAESPTAVTWKEFDEFLQSWQEKPNPATACEWVTSHSERVERHKLDVYREILSAAIRRYSELLHETDYALTVIDKGESEKKTSSLFNLLDCLLVRPTELGVNASAIGPKELDVLIEKFVSFANSNQPVHRQFWPQNERLIVNVFEHWKGDMMLLMQALGPYTSATRFRSFEGVGAAKLHQKLCDVTLPKFAQQVIADLRQPGFVERIMDDAGDPGRRMLLDADSPVWKEYRFAICTVLEEAKSDRVVQENAYYLLSNLLALRNTTPPYAAEPLRSPLLEQDLFDVVWKATTCVSLTTRAVYLIRELPGILQGAGIECELPQWWHDALSSLKIQVEPPLNPGGSDAMGPDSQV